MHPPRRLSHCSDCGQPLELAAVLAVARWAHDRHEAFRAKAVSPPRPGGLWCVQTAWAPVMIIPRLDTEWLDTLSVIDRAGVESIPEAFALYHDRCPGEDATWPARILAAPTDDELKLVYADALEESGQLERALFVRDLVATRLEPTAKRYGGHYRVPRWWWRMICTR